MSLPRIAGITRVRNEEHILADTLDHFSRVCPAGIYALDEASTDSTPEILIASPDVRGIDLLDTFETNHEKRRAFEGWGRQMPCDRAIADGAEWILCFDADERVEFDFEGFDWDSTDVVVFRLFDFYITPDDIYQHWSERKWIGPEYRDIGMVFRASAGFPFFDNRIATMHSADTRQHYAGYDGVVRHYGKAISVEDWEDTCHYYSTYQPEPFRSKWAARKGRAVHTHSDFGLPLCLWAERERYGIPLRTVEKQ